MYLRRNRRIVDGQTYECWTLVESVRTARGPRQHTVANLGKLPELDAMDNRDGRTSMLCWRAGKRRSNCRCPEWRRLGLHSKSPTGCLGRAS